MLHSFIIALMAFFAISNPFISLSVFLDVTEEYDTKTTKQIALRATLIAVGMVFVFSLFGEFIFLVFGITLYALEITGGIIVSLIGFKMLQGSSSNIAHPREKNMDHEVLRKAGLNTAITPLATPILAGPGTIATTMTLSAHNGIFGSCIVVVAFAIILIVTYILWLYGKNVLQHLGSGTMSFITRMMGLILAVIGVQMLISGADVAFPVLKYVPHLVSALKS